MTPHAPARPASTLPSTPEAPWILQARRQLTHNRHAYEAQLAHIKHLHQRGRLHDAAAHAMALGHFAWFNHTGHFAAPELETILQDIGHRLCPADPALPQRSHPTPDTSGNYTGLKVLHVMTEAYNIGGHTRYLTRWIDHDAANHHSVVLTQQPAPHAPGFLGEAIRHSNGQLHSLHGHALIAAARQLRTMAGGYDLISLNIHPHDVVPLLAFANPTGLPPVLFLNHADHVFWLGTHCTSILVNMRESGQRAAQHWRGMPPSMHRMLPNPMVLSTGEMLGKSQGQPTTCDDARSGAKQALGLPKDAVVLLSIGSHYKYSPISPELDFIHQNAQLVRNNPHVHLLVVGVNADDRWNAAKIELQGRLHTFAPTPDIATFFAAADIYLDSYPFASPTALLEAAMHAMPVATFHTPGDDIGVLRTDDLALHSSLLETSSLSAWHTRLQQLIDRPTLRRKIGAQARAAVEDTHMIPGWQSYLHGLYTQAFTTSLRSQLQAPDKSALTLTDELLVSLHKNGNQTQPIWRYLLNILPELTMRERLHTIQRFTLYRKPRAFYNLLPASLRRSFKKVLNKRKD